MVGRWHFPTLHSFPSPTDSEPEYRDVIRSWHHSWPSHSAYAVHRSSSHPRLAGDRVASLNGIVQVQNARAFKIDRDLDAFHLASAKVLGWRLLQPDAIVFIL